MDIFRHELAFEELTSNIIREFYEYWQKNRGSALYPPTSRINLDDLPRVKPYAAIASFNYPPFRVLYQFMGDQLIYFYGRDISKKWLDQVLEGEILQDFEMTHQMAATSIEPLLARSNWYGIDKTSEKTFEWGMFPISENGANVTGIIVVEDYSHFNKNELPEFLC